MLIFIQALLLKAIGFPTSMFTVLICHRKNNWMGFSMERND